MMILMKYIDGNDADIAGDDDDGGGQSVAFHSDHKSRQFYTTPPDISFVGILLGWPFKTPKSLG